VPDIDGAGLPEAESTIAPFTTAAWVAGGGAWLVTNSCSTWAALAGAGGKPVWMVGMPDWGACPSAWELLLELAALGATTSTSNVPPPAISRGAPGTSGLIPEPGILGCMFLPPRVAIEMSSPVRTDAGIRSPCRLGPVTSGDMFEAGPASAGCAINAAIAQAHSSAARPPARTIIPSWYAKRTTALLSPQQETRLG
jgi:hypothetical protein